jgi:Ca2+-binding RTX toxin-like protein
MFLRRAIEVLVRRKGNVVALTLLVFALTASTALAVTVKGDGTLVGTPGSDTLNAGMGNDILWGLGGKDVLNAGNGNDMIDGGGHCPMGDQGQDFPNGLPNSDQCEHNNQGDQAGNETFNAGNGNDTIFGGPGPNTINAGAGMDIIYGGPIGDTINLSRGNSNDTINLCGTANTAVACASNYKGSTVNLFSTDIGGTVYANNGQTNDTINCYGSPAVVHADKGDTVNNCPHVIRTAADAAGRAKRAKAGAAQAASETGLAILGSLRSTLTW